MFRDRTNLYLSYRRTIARPHKELPSRVDAIAEEEEGLISSRRPGNRKKPYHDNVKEGEAIEMKPLAPSIFDISNALDSHLADAKLKTNELNMLYKRLLIARDNERLPLESHIEELNYRITKSIEQCYVQIKKFEFLQKNYQRLSLKYGPDELAMIENYKKTYALKIQDGLLVFRNLQNNYMKFLKDDDDEATQLLLSSAPSTSSLLLDEELKDIEDYSRQALQLAQQQLQNPDSQLIAQREREISKVAMGILEISTIFKEMETLVVTQGSMMDRIDYNLTRTAQDLKVSDKELVKAQNYQKRTTKCKIIFLLLLIALALFIFVVARPHNSTKVVEKPSSESPGDGPSVQTTDPE